MSFDASSAAAITEAAARVVGTSADEITPHIRVALSLLAEEIGGVTIPQDVLDAATVRLATELFHAQGAPNGIRNVSDGMGGVMPIHIRVDPLAAVRPMLRPFIGPVIA